MTKKVLNNGRNSGKAKAKSQVVAVIPASKQASKYTFDGAAFEALITRVENSAKSFIADLDNALRCAALHHAHYGDTRALNRLFQATKKLVHKNTVALWIRENCAVTYDKADDAFKHSDVKMKLIKDDLNAYESHVDSAKPYYDLAKPDANPFKGFDLKAEVNKLIAQAVKMHEAKVNGVLKKGKEEVELSAADRDLIDVPMADLAALRRVFANTSETVLH
jgi:hypothetical protein